MGNENKTIIKSKNILSALNNIVNVASAETNDLNARSLKLMEEVGELAQAILSHSKTRGCEYKEKNINDVNEEVAGVIISCLATAVKVNGGLENLDMYVPIIDQQLNKWVNASDLHVELEEQRVADNE